MYLLGRNFVLSVTLALITSCGYGVYLLTRGGQDTVTNLEPQESLSNSLAGGRTKVQEAGSEGNSIPWKPSTLPEPSGPKWIMGENANGEGRLVVVFKAGKSPRNNQVSKFGQEFDIFANGQSLKGSDILCNLEDRKGLFFVMKYDSGIGTYKAVDESIIRACSSNYRPKNQIPKYLIKGSGNNSQPLQYSKLAISSCAITQAGEINISPKLQMTCKESTLPLFGRESQQRPDIFIELKQAEA